MSTIIYYLFESDRFNVLEVITKNYKIEKSREILGDFCFYDTFDFRLYFNDLCLYKKDNVLFLQGKGLKEVLSYNLDNNNVDFHFWWDITDGNVREVLKGIIDVRALNEIFKIKIESREYKIYNSDDKIIANLGVFNFPQFYFSLVRVNRIKGYKKEASNIKLMLDSTGAFKLKNILKFIFSKSGVTLEEYSTKINLKIKKVEMAYNSTKQILMHMLNIMEKNITGIKFHIDTEYLHDFRVATRRTRTALMQLQGVFREDYILPFSKGFAEITDRTNKARDLDIQFLYLIQLKFDFPEHLKPGLNLLLDHLNNLRIKEYSKVAKFLLSQKFNNTLNKWKKFLGNSNLQYAGENGLKPVGEVAPYYIFEALKRVKKKYQMALKDFNSKNLHKLRISCKKLRYVLEFFSPLYGDNIYEKVIDALKILQDTLGLYQDLEVQKKMLSDIMEGLSKTENVTSNVFLAAGYLFRLLEEKQQSSSTNFLDYFDNFNELIESKKFRKVLSF